MDTILTERSHRRFNILTGEWILVSPHRTKRPWQGKMETATVAARPSYDAQCYLCPTNTRANGEVNDNYGSTFSFINDFGALLLEGEPGTFKEGLLKGEAEKGICKVICFSPDHSLTLPLMEVEAITEVVQLWKREYAELAAISDINHVQIFENKGEIMGCSNPHPHGQIWAQRSIPEESRKKSEHQLAHYNNKGTTLLGDYLEQELELGERIILENNHFVALVPFWAVWPYEAMIIPKRSMAHLGELSGEEEQSFAETIKRVTTKYDNLFNVSFPYSAGIHQAPTDGLEHPEWHFHMSFYPPLLRSASIKKFMVGYEMFANPQRDITAEQAAKVLRQLPEVHYSQNVTR